MTRPPWEAAITRHTALLVANALTALRLALALAYPWTPRGLRAEAVLVAGLSDYLDGVVARRHDGASWPGGLLDAAADKLFVGIALLTAAAEGTLAAPWLAPLLARDVVVLAIAAYVAAHRRWDAFRRMPSRPLGKATTAVLFGLFLAVVLAPERRALVTGLATLGAATSVLAGADYAARFVAEWRAEREGPAP